MNIIRGSMTDPKVVFLDELTFCFDVRTSRTIRSFIKNWIKENKDSEIEEIKEFSFSKDNCWSKSSKDEFIRVVKKFANG